MNGRDGTTEFLPLDSKIGGQVGHVKPNIGQFLTRQQANYIYKKVETGEIINTDTMQQEMEQEEQLNRIDDTKGKTNPYQELIVNNAERNDPLMTQLEQWSILSNILNYVDSKISHKQNKIFSCETSFLQNPSWLLPGLRKMLFYTIYQTDGVLVNVYPKIYFG